MTNYSTNDAPALDDEGYWASLLSEERATTPANGEKPARSVVSIAASTIKMKAIKWVYQGRIPLGAITLLAGREGIGKSTIGFDLAARLTRGDLPGRYLGKPSNVGIVATEDAWEFVIRPRLEVAKADMNRVFRLEAQTDGGELETISAPEDLVRLAAECQRLDIKLLLVDPIMSVINGTLDAHKDREVRRALDPLSRFASVTGVAVLGLIHVNKSTTTDPLNSVMASRAFTAVARSVLYCIADAESPDEDLYLFGHPKCNVGPKQPSIQYRIIEAKIELDPKDVEEGDEAVICTSLVSWGQDDPRSIRDAMEGPPKGRPKGELNNAIYEWIKKQGRIVSRGEIIAAFPGVQESTIDKNLSRMVDGGQLRRPFSGHYALADGSAE